MKIAVLGGAGDVGSRAVEDLAVSEGIEQVTICDRDTAAAAQVAARLRHAQARVEVVAADADDHGSIVAALRGHDVAASALGPFHRFEERLVAAALDAGVDYASVCDEWQPALQVIEDLQERARAAGRRVVTGLGASPGLSNVGIRYLADRLEPPRRAAVSVYQPLDAGGGAAVVQHMLFIMSGFVTVWRHGGAVRVRACSESRMVEFPQFGSIRLWNMGHSEPVTLPRFIDGLDEAVFFMGFGAWARTLVLPARAGVFAGPRRRRLAARALEALERATGDGPPSHGAVRLDVWGRRDGAPAHEMLCGTGQMREVTGLSLSVGAQMLARRELTTDAPGVYAPEGCIAPVPFIRRMRDKGVVAYADVGMREPLAV